MTGNDRVNILMVDDQPAKLLSYEVILKELGENLIRANSGKEALERLLKTDIAVILMDVSMPDMNGFELAEMIRQHPRFQKTAIVFISGVHLTDVDRIQGYQRGGVDYISVPVVPQLLRAKISVFAELHRKTRQLELLHQDLERRITDRLLAQKQAFELAASELSLIEVLEHLARSVESQLQQGEMVAIHLLDESGTRFEWTAAPSLPNEYRQATAGMEVSRGAGPCCAAVSTGQRIAVDDFTNDHQFPAFISFALPLGIRAGWSAPIVSSTGKVLGTVANYFRDTRQGHLRDDLLSEIVTRTAAVVIERKRSEELLRLRADELSRFNRLAVGRELRMIELKKEINELCDRLGQARRYHAEFAQPEGIHV